MEGYKFLRVENKANNRTYLALVKLEIPDDAKVVYPIDTDYYLQTGLIEEPISSLNYRRSIKCRCNKAKIVEIIQYYDVVGVISFYYKLHKITHTYFSEPSYLEFKSLYNDEFCYKFDKYVEPDSLDTSIHTECSHGIHFCKTILDAKKFMENNGYCF